MAEGSLLAGMAFGNTGTHLSHALQYPVGALTHTPHGLGTGLLLPYVLQACAPHTPDRIADIGEALGVGRDVQRTIARVAEITENIGLPRSLADLGVAVSDLDRIAELALSSRRLVNISPAPADVELLRTILTAAHAGDRQALRS